MRDVSFGQYYPSDSFVHRCDPRTKILFLIFYIVSIFLATNFYALGACAFVFLVVAICSGVPIKSMLRSVKAIMFLLLFTTLLTLFFSNGTMSERIYTSAFLAVRLFLLVLGSSVLTLTTTPVALTNGIESLLNPLKRIGFPVHELALIMSIALRFIPILTDETSRIMNAQKARGADFETGGLLQRMKAIVPILIPLLISAFRRADELGDAMDARCYAGSKERTKYKRLRYAWRDGVAFGVILALLSATILLRIYTVALI